MTYKEANAGVMLVSQVLIAAWLWRDTTTNPAAYETLTSTAGKLLWAIGIAVIFNIIAIIIVAIIGSIVTREEFKDERDDERDRSVNTRSMRNAYVVASIGGLAILILMASNAGPITAAFVLFGVLMAAGATDAASRLVYYRLG
jgi:hypothetical protein